jgi:hypothetical protein
MLKKGVKPTRTDKNNSINTVLKEFVLKFFGKALSPAAKISNFNEV